MTELEYLDANPFQVDLRDAAGVIRVSVKIARCPEQGGCGDHPYIEAFKPGMDEDERPMMVPLTTVEACIAFGIRMAAALVTEGDGEQSAAGWDLIERLMTFRREMNGAVARANLN